MNTNTQQSDENPTDGRSDSNGGLGSPPYKERAKLARTTKNGDNWKHLKTGKTVIVLGRVGLFGVSLLHQSGKKTIKLDHYLASDYELLVPN